MDKIIQVPIEDLLESLKEGYHEYMKVKSMHNKAEAQKIRGICIGFEKIIFTYAPEFKNEVIAIREGIVNSNIKSYFQGDIKNCTFSYKCPLKWNNLKETDNSFIRYCNVCNENVHLVMNEEHFKYMAKNRKCVFIDMYDGEELGIPSYMKELDKV